MVLNHTGAESQYMTLLLNVKTNLTEEKHYRLCYVGVVIRGGLCRLS